MLVDDIKKRMFAAMKAGRTVEKEILRVALGEVQSAEAREERTFSDADVHAVLRKLVKSNREALGAAEDPQTKAELQEELAILASLLPPPPSVDEIVTALEPVAAAIRGAAATGAAMGLAMKHLAASNIVADGKDVGQAVARIRS